MLGNNWLAFIVTLAAAVIWVKLVGFASDKGILDRPTSRKLIHIGTGPVYVLCWLLFNDDPSARWIAAIVPFLITLQFFLVGSGVIKDEKTVKSMSREGGRGELLRGPTFYGVMFVLMTLLAWKDNPYGIVALMVLCGGDGLADLLGSRIKSTPLPWSKTKSWLGSIAFFLGGSLLSLGVLAIFNSVGVFDINWSTFICTLIIVWLVATIVESLPLKEVDNITVPIAS